MTRVWLSAREWACCGDPFAVGDEVNFVIGRRSPSKGFVRDLGAELSATVDAFEARHPERPVDDRVRGRVVAVQIVLQETVHRFTLRHPGYGAPPDAEMPAEGELWPLAGRDLGNGLFVGTRPKRWMRESEPLPGSVELVPSDAVPGDVADSADSVSETDLDGPQPSPQRARVRRGWLVDVEEGDV